MIALLSAVALAGVPEVDVAVEVPMLRTSQLDFYSMTEQEPPRRFGLGLAGSARLHSIVVVGGAARVTSRHWDAELPVTMRATQLDLWVALRNNGLVTVEGGIGAQAGFYATPGLDRAATLSPLFTTGVTVPLMTTPVRPTISLHAHLAPHTKRYSATTTDPFRSFTWNYNPMNAYLGVRLGVRFGGRPAPVSDAPLE